MIVDLPKAPLGPDYVIDCECKRCGHIEILRSTDGIIWYQKGANEE